MSAVRVVCRREIGILTQVDGDAPVARQRLDPSGTARTGPWITAPLAGVGAWQTSAAQTLDAKAAPIVAATEALAIDPAADALVLDAIRRRSADEARRAARTARGLGADEGDERN